MDMTHDIDLYARVQKVRDNTGPIGEAVASPFPRAHHFIKVRVHGCITLKLCNLS